MDIVRIDVDTSPAADLDAWHEVHLAAHRADRPLVLSPTRRFTLDRLRPEGGPTRTARLIRDERGTPVATMHLDVWRDPRVSHLASADVVVHPQARRRGFGRRLMSGAIAGATQLGRETLVVSAVDASPGVAFCTAMGFTRVHERVESVLDLAAVDWSAVCADSADRPGYALVGWSGACPDAELSRYGTVLAAMQDEPTGGLDVRHNPVTAAVIRSSERTVAWRHHRRHVLCAVENATGEFAAVTRIDVHEEFEQAAQGPTAVTARHRGRGLGLWVKSAMLLRLAAAEPHVTQIKTSMAVDNPHVRRINDHLGFRPVLSVAEFQLSVANVQPSPAPPNQLAPPPIVA